MFYPFLPNMTSLGVEMQRQGTGIVIFLQKNRQEIEDRFPSSWAARSCVS